MIVARVFVAELLASTIVVVVVYQIDRNVMYANGYYNQSHFWRILTNFLFIFQSNSNLRSMNRTEYDYRVANDTCRWSRRCVCVCVRRSD